MFSQLSGHTAEVQPPYRHLSPKAHDDLTFQPQVTAFTCNKVSICTSVSLRNVLFMTLQCAGVGVNVSVL